MRIVSLNENIPVLGHFHLRRLCTQKTDSLIQDLLLSADLGGLGRAMVLGSFQVLGGWCFFFFFIISSSLFSFSNASSLGRLLDMLKYCGLGRHNPTVVVSYYRRCAR